MHNQPRRRFLALLPGCVFAGCNSPSREAPARAASPPPASSTSPSVTLVDFSADGGNLGTVTVSKVVLSDDEWRERLSPLAFSVMRRKDTEVAFTGRYNKHSARGVYRCAGCRTALFSSETKFDSGTGWPSFWAPIATENIYTAMDDELGITREEVLCRGCDGHLGHVFPDGPAPTGLRYCMNSAALAFES